MTYDEIKANLANARSLLDAGNVAGAYRIILGMRGHGLTLADVEVGLTASQLVALRNYQRQIGGAR